jgi:hypothetical protein
MKLGDLVRLKSGSPAMVVVEATDDYGKVGVIYFSFLNHTINYDSLVEECLILTENESGEIGGEGDVLVESG